MRYLIISICVLLFAALSMGQLSFTQDPSLTKEGSNYYVEFAVNQNTDVAVSIVNPADSTVVRHLAAGMLGASAPAPLASNSLSQRIQWDGTNNMGNTVANPDGLSARVRAGMSARLAGFAGEHYYVFNTTFGGIVLGQDGSLFILGSAGRGNSRSYFLRQYEPSGDYRRTVFPPAVGLPLDSVQGYSINVLPGGGWAPKTTFCPNPQVTSSLLNKSTTQLLPIGQPGELVLVNGTDMQIISESGALADAQTRKIITAPAPPENVYRLCGPRYFTNSHSPDYMYLSGYYYGTVDMGTWLVNALDTGFWADGQVFKVDRQTGVVSQWLKLDSIPVSKDQRKIAIGGGANATATIHGVALEDSGRVLICDRLHKCIGVYDTNGVKVGELPVPNPDLVAVSKRTGNVYVISRNDAVMSLVKLPNWRTPGTVLDQTVLVSSINTHTGAPCLQITETADKTIIWAGYSRFGVRQYEDDGSGFTLIRDFSAGYTNLVYDRIDADPNAEMVYFTNSGSDIYKIRDWSNPVPVRCSTTTNQPLIAADLCIAPNGFMYIRGKNAFDGPIERWGLGNLHAPVPYGNTGSNLATGDLYGRMGVGWGDKGLAVNPQGIIGTIFMVGWNDYAYSTFSDTGSSNTSGSLKVSNLGGQCGGVRFDLDGNVYLGMDVVASDQIVPEGYAGDWGFGMGGAVVKYAPGATGSISGGTASGASKVYPQPYGAFSADGMSSCVCRSPRFDVDPYGRLFIPHGATGQVNVADNSGNTLLTFGEYGNTDSKGGLPGLGQTIAEPDIPLAWPIAVAATEDYVYINDWVNARLARVQLMYELDNMPDLTAYKNKIEDGSACEGLGLSAAPCPFNPISTLTLTLPGSSIIRINVFDASGRLVRKLVSGKFVQGIHRFTWDGTNTSGQQVSTGLYVYRLTAGNRVLNVKTILAK